MVFLRLLGLWFLLIAMVALVVDGTKSLASGGAWVVTALGDQWRALSPASLDASQRAVVEQTSATLWDPIITTILMAPTWVVFAALGLFLYWLGRKRRRLEIYTN